MHTAQAGYGSVGGSFESANAVTDRVLLLDEATDLTRNAIQRLRIAADFLRTKADDVFGSRPTATVGNTGSQALPKILARAEGLRSVGSELHQAISDLESEMERFRAI